MTLDSRSLYRESKPLNMLFQTSLNKFEQHRRIHPLSQEEEEEEEEYFLSSRVNILEMKTLISMLHKLIIIITLSNCNLYDQHKL